MNTKISLLLFFFLLVGSLSAYPQEQREIDSLLTVLPSVEIDTSKINILNRLCYLYRNKSPQKALEYGKQGLQLAEETGYKKGVALALYSLGILYKNQGNFDKAIEHQLVALKINKELEQLPDEKLARAGKDGVAQNYNAMGIVFSRKGDFGKSIEYYLKALKIMEELNDKRSIVGAFSNIGSTYAFQGNFEKALEYFQQSLKTVEELNDKQAIGVCLGNIGYIYFHQKDYEKAIEYFQQSLNIGKEEGDKRQMTTGLNNIGFVYRTQGKYEEAMDYSMQALEINRELEDKDKIAQNYINIGTIYEKQKQYKKAIDYYTKGLKLAKEIDTKQNIKNAYSGLSGLYAGQNDYKNAYDNLKLWAQIKDSLYNEEKSKQITEMQTKYDTEKKEQEIDMLNKDKAIQAVELNRKNIVIGAAIAVLVLVIVFSFFLYNRFRVTKRQKKIIESQKAVVDEKNKNLHEAKAIIEEKNMELTDSINYAQRIQAAMLTSEGHLNDMFLPVKQSASHFVLFKPKDIVSGDFYWAHQTTDGKAIWAVADCTGHGVPGAFMSMIGISLLNETIVEGGIYEADKILNKLREGIVKALGQTGEEGATKDGMDIALCVWKKPDLLQFSGANNPLWLIRNNTFQIVRADRQPIGFHTEEVKPFTQHEIQLQQGDTVYIFSDGFQDQFGGPKGKKFMAKNFQTILLEIQDKSMSEQKEILNQTIDDWKKDYEQIDDICVFGVRV